MKFHGVEIKDFDTLCRMLAINHVEKIYLIHQPERESEAREFAARLRNKGFVPMVAADYRKHGEQVVSKAIENSQFCLVLAFDDKEMKECQDKSITFIHIR